MMSASLDTRLQQLGLIALIMGLSMPVRAQEEEIGSAVSDPRNKLALFTGTSWLPQGRDPVTDELQTVIAAVYGLDYEFRVSERWAIGSYNDITLVRVAVEEENGTFLERDNAVLFSMGGSYELFHRFAVELSFGVETDANATLPVGRIGAEYAIPMANEWELGITSSYVNKEVYDVFSIGLLVGKRF